MKNKSKDQIDTSPEEMSAALYQRTEELYQIQNAPINSEGLIECTGFILDDVIVYPKMISPILIKNDKKILAIKVAQNKFNTVIGLIPLNNQESSKTKLNLLPIGIELAIGQLLNLSDGGYSALIQGRRRVEIIKITQEDPFYMVLAKPVVELSSSSLEIKAMVRATKDLFEQCVQLDRSLPDEANIFSLNINEPGWLTDMVATALSPSLDDRRKLLLLTDPLERLIFLNKLLAQELDVLRLEDDIQIKVQKEVDKSQREFYLREQVKTIQHELGEGDIWEQEIENYKKKIKDIKLPEDVFTIVMKEIERLSIGTSLSPEVSIIRNYLDWIIELPWKKFTRDNLNIHHAARILEKNHFGLNKAKERLIEYLAVRSLQPTTSKQPIICFVGPPGTGKTSLGKSIAEALGRNFVRISLGGIRDEAEIRGHRRTYIGALPGRIIQTMRRAGTQNPLFMLDEIDKLGTDFRGDPGAALLEVLDPEQNCGFSDHYLEIPYDLSQVIFITTANSIESIPPALLDRMEVIDFPGYIEEEKVEIAKKYLIKKQLQENGLLINDIIFDKATIKRIIREYTFEAGVRNLEREIGKICRKVAKLKSEGSVFPRTICANMLNKYLGPEQYIPFRAESQDEVGVATAIAWTENGGEIMPVEVLIFEGKGNMQITGQIGEVMQESAQAALSFIKSKSKSLRIEIGTFEKVDIHVHIPEGANPKDGPSAGVTIATAIVSAFTKRKVYRDIGMTGEITLRGKVLYVGGVREKILAAHRAGLKKVLLPRNNLKDLVDIPPKAIKELTIIPIDHLEEIFRNALYPD